MKPFRLLPLLLALVFLFGLAACSKEPVEHEGYLLAENTGGDFDFYYPDTWQVERADAGFVQVHVSDTDFSNISVSALHFAGRFNDLKTYVNEYYLKEIKENLNDVKTADNEDGSLRLTPLTVDGCDAVSFDYSASFYTVDSGKETYSFRTWLISNGGTVYNVTFTANTTEKDLFSEHVQEAAKTVEYFRFR